MASGAQLRLNTPYRAIHVGFPGSGKTGAIVSLLNAGYKVRVLDFEGNFEPLIHYADERALANLDVVTCFDKYTNDGGFVTTLGKPEAFNKALLMMQEWKYTNEDGSETNLGASATWGSDTVVVVDSLTSLGAAIMRRAVKFNNKQPNNITSAVWGHAVKDQDNFLDLLRRDDRKYHLIVNAHLQLIGPQDFLAQGDENAVKEKKLEMIDNGMIAPRYYPISVTKNSSQRIHGKLPTMLRFENVMKNGVPRRVIKTVSDPSIDVKISGKALKETYFIENGLAEIFEALGHKAPGF